MRWVEYLETLSIQTEFLNCFIIYQVLTYVTTWTHLFSFNPSWVWVEIYFNSLNYGPRNTIIFSNRKNNLRKGTHRVMIVENGKVSKQDRGWINRENNWSSFLSLNYASQLLLIYIGMWEVREFEKTILPWKALRQQLENLLDWKSIHMYSRDIDLGEKWFYLPAKVDHPIQRAQN